VADTTQPSGTRRPDSPYKGLIPYEEADAPYFFGRDRDREVIISNLLASRLTVLSAESGVGKTSVLRAGVVHELRRQARTDLAEDGRLRYVVVDFAAWNDDPIEGLAKAIEGAATELRGDRTPAAPPPTRRLDELLEAWAERLDADLLLVLDQFEDYFLYHGEDAGDGTFAVELPRAVTRPDLQANFLISIREDAALKLDRFKPRMPDVLANRIGIRRLDRTAAERTIRGPIERYNAALPDSEQISIEDDLVGAVLDEVSQVRVGQPGEGTVVGSPPTDARIEMSYLQLVMLRLWERERAAGSTILHRKTLDELGGARRIVGTHVESIVNELPTAQRDIAAEVFGFLVTPEGAKIAVPASYLAENSGHSIGDIEPVLAALARKEASILRPIDSLAGERLYEIYHDALAPVILEWTRGYRENRRRAKAEEGVRREAEARVSAARQRARRFAFGGLIALALTVSAAAVALYADSQRQVAVRAADAARVAEALAQSQGHVDLALQQLSSDPQSSLHHALMAWGIVDKAGVEDRSSAEEAVRLALSRSNLDAVVDQGTVVWSAAWSPDGTRIVTAGQDGIARVVEVADGKTVELGPQTNQVLQAVFTPDGKHVITTTGLGGSIKLWDLETGALLWTVSGNGISGSDGFGQRSVYMPTGAFSADGRYVVTTASRDQLQTPQSPASASIRSLDTGVVVQSLPHPETVQQVNSAAFSPDGKRVVTAADDGFARIWDAATGAVEHELDNKTSTKTYPTIATFSPDGKLIACANSDGSVGIFDAATGGPLDFSFNHKGPVKTVAFSADSTRLVSAGGKTAVVLDLAPLANGGRATLETTLSPQASWIDSAEFSPDRAFVLASYQDGTARVAAATTGAELVAFRGHANIVWTARFSPNGSRVVTASEDGTARVWRVNSGHVAPEAVPNIALAHGDVVHSVAFSPDGSRVATTSNDGSGAIWDATSGERLQDLKGAYFLATWNERGDQLLTTQVEGTVARWTFGIETPQACCVHKGTTALTATYVPGRDDRTAVLYADGSIGIWALDDTGSSGATEVVSAKPDDVTAIALSPDGTELVTVGRSDRKAHIRRTDSLQDKEKPFDLQLVSSINFSPDGHSIITAQYDGTVRIWDAETGAEIDAAHVLTLRPAAGEALVARFSQNGLWILAGTIDGTTRIWDAPTRTLLGDIRVQAGSINSIDTHISGSAVTILTGGDDRSARIFSCEICGSFDQVLGLAQAQLDIWDPDMAGQ
jgi:WD40 repeat protein